MADTYAEQQQRRLGCMDTCFEWLIRSIIHLPRWMSVGLALGLLGLPFGLAYVEGGEGWAMVRLSWRYLVLPSALLIYTVAAMPWVWQAEQQMVQALRPLVQLDDARFDSLVRNGGRRTARHAWTGFAIGVAGGGVFCLPSLS
jgi:hypothetical protein